MSTAWARLVAMLAVLSCLGCGSLSGTHDVELTYRATLTGGDAAAARVLVMRRLSAARLAADVVADRDGTIHLTVDEAHAARVDELVMWPGGLEIYAVTDGDGERGSRRRLLGDGATGGRADVVIEPDWSTAEGAGEPEYVARRVSPEPLGRLGAGLSVAWGRGPTLVLRVAPQSVAEAGLASARAAAAGRPLAIVMGRTSLGPLTGDAMTLTFGDGLAAYTRAEHVRALLTSPALPPMRRLDRRPLPANVVLAALCLALPVALSALWLVFVRRFDRAHPEPGWLVITTFALGGASAALALGAEIALASLSPYLHPALVSMGGRVAAFPLAWLVLTVVVGLVEEGSKLLGAVFATRRREFDEPIDGILYAIASSLGFAAVENVRYFALGRLAPPLVIARSFMSVPAHMFFGALWGFALGQRLVSRKARLGAWLVAAAAAHGLFDALLTTRGAASLAIPLNVALAALFIVLVRRALRHGVVTAEVRSSLGGERRLFPVGRPFVFYASATALVLFAFLLFAVGASYQVARYRPEAAFIVSSSVLLTLLAVAALGVSWAVPLDVVIDRHGITFAGAARSWAKVRGARREGRVVVAECDGGDIDLGPAPPAVLDAITEAIERRREERGEAP